MALASIRPDGTVIPTDKTVPEVAPEDNKSLYNEFTAQSRINSLLKYVSGYNWSVTYYGQILNEANTLEPFDISTPSFNQPYYKLHNALIKVSEPLSSNYDTQTGVTHISGSGIAPLGIKPNVGDVILATVDTGELAYFIVTSVTRKTYRKDTLYDISYALYGYLNDNFEISTTLESRVQQSYYYDTNGEPEGITTLVNANEKTDRDTVKNFLKDSQEYYLDYFAPKQSGTLYCPSADYKLYDGFLLNFLYRIMDYDVLLTHGLRHYSDSNNRFLNISSIWDFLIDKNISKLSVYPKRYAYIPSYMLKNKHRYGTVFYAGIDYILFPVDQDVRFYNKDVFSDTIDISDGIIHEPPYTSLYNDVEELKISVPNSGGNRLEFLHPILTDMEYILTPEFYRALKNKSTPSTLSYIEYLIIKYILDDTLDCKDMIPCIENIYSAIPLVQFYMLPVLWLLGKFSLRC